MHMIANDTLGLLQVWIKSMFIFLFFSPLFAKDNFEATIDLLYLMPLQDGLDFVWEPKSSGSDDLVELGKVIPKSPDFSYDFGFRVGLLSPVFTSSWSLLGQYTYFNGKNGASVYSNIPKLIPLLTLGSITSSDFEVANGATANLDTTLHMGDVLLKYPKTIGYNTQITPFFGLKILSLDQDYRVKYSDVRDEMTLLGDQSFVSSQDFINFGPVLGVELDLNFWSYFHIFGKGTGALIGKEVNQTSTFTSEMDDLSLRLVVDNNTIKPILETAIGIAYKYAFPKWTISVKASYEMFVFFKSYLFVSSKGESTYYDISLMGVTGSIGIGF